MAGERGRQIENENRVAALGGAVLHHVFPVLAVFVFLRFAPGLAGGEVNGLRIRRPGKVVHAFFSLRDGEGFAAAGRDQVDLAVFVFGVRVSVRVGIFAFF